jgi:hypothetical protein
VIKKEHSSFTPHLGKRNVTENGAMRVLHKRQGDRPVPDRDKRGRIKTEGRTIS